MSDWTNDDNLDDLNLDFDPATHVPAPSTFDPLPAGTYRFAVTSIKPKMISNGTTRQITVELTVTEGDHRGRKVWARHSDRTTRTDDGMQTSIRIGRDRLAELMQASGASGTNLSACVGAEVEAKIKVRPARGDYEASNDVVAYFVPKATTSTTAKPAASSSRPGFMSRKG